MKRLNFLVRTGLILVIIFITFKWIRKSDFKRSDQTSRHHNETCNITQFTPVMRQSVTLCDGEYYYHLNLSSFESEFPHLQTYQCSVILSPPVAPYDDSDLPLIIMAVKSHPGAGTNRYAVRQTWAREQEMKGYKLRRLFLVGRTENSGQMELLKVESVMYGDILQWDMMEGHHNLSLKERCFLEWMYHHVPEVHHIYKGDDDEFVNTELVVDLIIDFGSPDLIHGFHLHRPPVLRDTKYRITETLYPLDNYPGFVSGGGFIFSGRSVSSLYAASRILPVFPLDDVYFGFLALAANLTFKHEFRFYVRGLDYDVCRYKEALVVHGVSTERLIAIWREVTEHKCKRKKHKWRMRI